MKMYVKKEIIQIMNAPDNFEALYEQENGENFADPVVAFAIVEEEGQDDDIRYVEGMILDEETGTLELVSSAENFVGMKRK